MLSTLADLTSRTSEKEFGLRVVGALFLRTRRLDAEVFQPWRISQLMFSASRYVSVSWDSEGLGFWRILQSKILQSRFVVGDLRDRRAVPSLSTVDGEARQK